MLFYILLFLCRYFFVQHFYSVNAQGDNTVDKGLFCLFCITFIPRTSCTRQSSALKRQKSTPFRLRDSTEGISAIYKADDGSVQGVRWLRITLKIAEITRFGACCPLYINANVSRETLWNLQILDSYIHQPVYIITLLMRNNIFLENVQFLYSILSNSFFDFLLMSYLYKYTTSVYKRQFDKGLIASIVLPL